jgi:hypothetical protein
MDNFKICDFEYGTSLRYKEGEGFSSAHTLIGTQRLDAFAPSRSIRLRTMISVISMRKKM